MLEITIPAIELWDDRTQEFTQTKEQTLRLEHSLVSLSKWESKWCKPFLTKEIKTREETVDYIRCMTLTQNVDPDVYKYVTDANIKEVNEYIEAKMTATWFSDKKSGKGGKRKAEQPTSELIYYWMISHNIPMECQKWHLNRLLTLVKVCDVKSQPPKKRGQKEMLSERAALNAARKKQLNTRG